MLMLLPTNEALQEMLRCAAKPNLLQHLRNDVDEPSKATMQEGRAFVTTWLGMVVARTSQPAVSGSEHT